MATPKSNRQYNNSKHKNNIWDILTAILFVGLFIQTGYFIWLYLYPSSPLNLYPPPSVPTMPIAQATPLPAETATDPPPTTTPSTTNEPSPIPAVTDTPVIVVTEPTSTATVVINPTQTFTPDATIIEITPIPDGGDPSNIFFTPTATLRITYLYRFVLQAEPYAIEASSTDPNKDCKWMGVGGQVFDLQGRPATGINVKFGGVIDKKTLPNLITLTGTATQYGLAGYEFKIADEVFDSYLSLWVQLVDQSGNPLSAKTTFSTFADCKKNLIIINFKQVR